MIAATVATPLLELKPHLKGTVPFKRVVEGSGVGAAYVEVGGFVVALTAKGVPLMPNGVGLTGPAPAPGATVRVALAGAVPWEPRLRLPADAAQRGAAVLDALGAAPPDDDLARAVAAGDPDAARAAAAGLVGLGPGLTPEGDDRLAGTAAVLAARGWAPTWLPGELRRRTSALSATLLELAAAGRVVEPVHGLFGDRWRPALERLLAIGGSTGRAYATSAAAAATLS